MGEPSIPSYHQELGEVDWQVSKGREVASPLEESRMQWRQGGNQETLGIKWILGSKVVEDMTAVKAALLSRRRSGSQNDWAFLGQTGRGESGHFHTKGKKKKKKRSCFTIYFLLPFSLVCLIYTVPENLTQDRGLCLNYLRLVQGKQGYVLGKESCFIYFNTTM